MMLKAKDVMTTEVATIKGSATVADAVKKFNDLGVRALIVDRRHEQDAYGIITETDVVYKVTAFGRDPKRMRVFEIMTKPCIAVNPDLGVEYVARLFAQTHIHIAPVIQETLLGIISIGDILSRGDFVEKPKSLILAKRIEQAIAEARQICAQTGPTSKKCAAAWDIVEELQAEASHQKAERLEKTAFEEYCEENPDAFEARIYDS
ncbi:MAG: CBS domain-containing protein [Oscillatoriales cyanobacterium RM1_1_9]|nr:CBS domain-containing protein [Oscillatoriales cyanobacterium SM2_3_0]NJO46264.1 CBS domain-containing protein [Oscillatoriales cyanobacterium RM2_1_1]NJO71863.1 CBS domain-containing protein [Oscillatoriales cyanobacterium RM1_1_9]